MFTTRQAGITAGILYLVTHVTSVTARAVLFAGPLAGDTFDPMLVRLGVLLEVMLALAVVGTSIALYPIVQRASEGLALGYVALRTLEAGVILTGAVAMLTFASFPSEPALLELYDWTFVVGPGLVCPANTLVLAVLLYRSRLVPRFIPVLGLIGAPLVFAINAAKVFGVFGAIESWAGIGVVPIFAWEVSLAVYLIIRGVRRD